jgi:hypothetical protein
MIVFLDLASSASAPCPDGLAPFDEAKMALMLRLHNGSLRIAAMQQLHDLPVNPWDCC